MWNNKTNHLKKCKAPDCQGHYCLKCFSTLENLCTTCQHPNDYGNSSEEEFYNRKSHRKCRSQDSGNEKYVTFKDTEVRDGFKDMESNKFTDYNKVSNQYGNKKALKKRLKVVLQNHIENVKNEKNKQIKIKSIYTQIRCKVEDLISRLKRKKLKEMSLRKTALIKKFEEKIDSLKYFKREKRILETLPNETSTSKVTFNVETNNPECNHVDYKRLKEKVRARIERLKEKKNLGDSVAHKTSINDIKKSIGELERQIH